MHIANIPDMINRFGVKIGISDHSAGHIAAVIAVANGACVVEKHVKLEGVESADSKFSMSMEEFATMVQAVRDTKSIIGNVCYGPTAGEQGNLKFRRSLYAIQDICQGDIISSKNVRSIRPSCGLPPKCFQIINGKKAKVDIPRGTALTMEMFDG